MESAEPHRDTNTSIVGVPHDGRMTRTRAMHRAAAVVLLCSALAGCTATATDAQPTRTPTSTRTPSPTTSCIVGSWAVGAAELQPVYDALPSGLEYPAATIDPAASATISFAPDGAFAFAQSVPTTVTWMGYTASVALGGAMTGEWKADGDALALTARENGLTVVPTDDRTASAIFAAETGETLAEWPVTASSFTCDGDRLVLGLGTEGVPASVPFLRQ